jgi:hypothetical protein
MESKLVRRDQFNIFPQGIVHKPTDAAFTPHQAIKRAAEHHGTRPGAGIAGDRAGRSDGGEETWLFGRAFLQQDS